MQRAIIPVLFVLSLHLLPAGPRLPAQEPPRAAYLAGVAVRDVTPSEPIWLSGYAARNRPSERVDHPLLVQALALEDRPHADLSGERLVLVSIDNCEVSREFTAPVLEEVSRKHSLPADAVIIVSSHTHSAPCLDQVLPGMFRFEGVEKERVAAYSDRVRSALVEVVGGALADLKPARLRHGQGRAGFAMNRRVYVEDRVDFGENPEGPVDEDVPVLEVSGEDGRIRAILFGYACHGTTLGGEEFYVVSGDYMAYAREHLEAVFPGARAIYLTGCGADSNPSPRNRIHFAKQHGLELAGAVAGVLGRPMRPVTGPLRRAFRRLELPLAAAPERTRIEADAGSENRYVKSRALQWLALLESGKELPRSVSFPMAVARLGDGPTLFFLAGEPVVDYSLKLKRLHAAANPWTVGYAFEVPCYIPSARILNEGGYEADSSLIYYGIYGPLLPRCETMILDAFRELEAAVRAPR
jgi:hypothetical protein